MKTPKIKTLFQVQYLKDGDTFLKHNEILNVIHEDKDFLYIVENDGIYNMDFIEYELNANKHRNKDDVWKDEILPYLVTISKNNDKNWHYHLKDFEVIPSQEVQQALKDIEEFFDNMTIEEFAEKFFDSLNMNEVDEVLNTPSNNDNDPLIQYFIVNNELSMSKGKVSAQVSHASTILAVRDAFTANFNEWLNNIKRVIVLQADEEEMLYIHDNVPKSIKIVDKGFTEIPENSFTVLGLPIMRKSEAKEHVGHLKLLK